MTRIVRSLETRKKKYILAIKFDSAYENTDCKAFMIWDDIVLIKCKGKFTV